MRKYLVAVLSGVCGAETVGLILLLSPFAWYLPQGDARDVHRIAWSGWREESAALGAVLVALALAGILVGLALRVLLVDRIRTWEPPKSSHGFLLLGGGLGFLLAMVPGLLMTSSLGGAVLMSLLFGFPIGGLSGAYLFRFKRLFRVVV